MGDETDGIAAEQKKSPERQTLATPVITVTMSFSLGVRRAPVVFRSQSASNFSLAKLIGAENVRKLDSASQSHASKRDCQVNKRLL